MCRFLSGPDCNPAALEYIVLFLGCIERNGSASVMTSTCSLQRMRGSAADAFIGSRWIKPANQSYPFRSTHDPMVRMGVCCVCLRIASVPECSVAGALGAKVQRLSVAMSLGSIAARAFLVVAVARSTHRRFGYNGWGGRANCSNISWGLHYDMSHIVIYD